MKTLTIAAFSISMTLGAALAIAQEDPPRPPRLVPNVRPVRGPQPMSQPTPKTQAQPAAQRPAAVAPAKPAPKPQPKPQVQPAPASGDLRAQATAAGQPCLYGGNLSTYVYYESKGRTYCAPVRSVTLGGKKYSCNESGKAICNPLYYGMSDNGPLCVSQGNGALKECAAKGDVKKAAKFIVDNKLEQMQRDTAIAIQKNVCGALARGNEVVAERRKIYSVSCPLVATQQAAVARELASILDGAAPAATPAKTQAQPPAAAATPVVPLPRSRPSVTQAPAAPTSPPAPPADPQREVPAPATGRLPDERPKLEAGCQNCEVEVPNPAPKTVVQTVADRKKVLQQACADFTAKIKPKVHEDFPTANISMGWDPKKEVNELVKLAHAVIVQEKEIKTGCPEGCARINMPEFETDNRPKGRTPPKEGCPAEVTNAFKKPAKDGGRSNNPVTQSEVRAYDPATSLANGVISKRFTGKKDECSKASAEWAEGLLTAGTKLGKWADDELCPGSCSFSSVITTVDNSTGGNCDLTTKVDLRCGPPKKSYEWVTTGKVIAKWRCEAK